MEPSETEVQFFEFERRERIEKAYTGLGSKPPLAMMLLLTI